MTWVWVIGGAALAGLIMLAAFALWLWRKAVRLFAELEVVAVRAGDALALLDQLDWQPLQAAASRVEAWDAYTD